MKTGVATVRKTRNYIDSRRITHAAELWFHLGSRFVILRGFDFGDVIIYSKHIPTAYFTIYEENENSESGVNSCKCASSSLAVSNSGNIMMFDMEFTLSLKIDHYQKMEPFGVSVSAILSRGDRFRGTCNPSICSLKSISVLSSSSHEEIEGLLSETLVSSKSQGPPQMLQCGLQVTDCQDIRLPRGENQKALSDASESKQRAFQPSPASRLLNVLHFHPKSTHVDKNTVIGKSNASILQETSCQHSQNTLGRSPSPKNVFNVPQIEGSLIKEDLKINTEEIKETCEASLRDVSKNKKQYVPMPGLTHMPTKNPQESHYSALSKGSTSLTATNTIDPFHNDLHTSSLKGDSDVLDSSNEAGRNILSEIKNTVSFCKSEKSSCFLQPDHLPSTSPENFDNQYISMSEFEEMRKFARTRGKDVLSKDSKLDAEYYENSALNTSHSCGRKSPKKTSNDLEFSENNLEPNNITNVSGERHKLSENPCSIPPCQSPYISFQELEAILKKKFPSGHNANHDNSPATDVSIQQNIQSVEKNEKCLMQTTLTVKVEKEGRTSEVPVSSEDTFRSPYLSLEEFAKFKKNNQPSINYATFRNKSTNIALVVKPTKTETNASVKETSVTLSKQNTSHNSETNEKQFKFKKSVEENKKIAEPTLQLSSISQTFSTPIEAFSVIQKTVESEEANSYSKNEDSLNTENKISFGNPALGECYGFNRDERNSGIYSAAYNLNPKVKENPPEPPPRPAHTFRNPYMTVSRLSTTQNKNVDVARNGVNSEKRSVRASKSSETSIETPLSTSESNVVGNKTHKSSPETSFKPSRRTQFTAAQEENSARQSQPQKSCGFARTTTSPDKSNSLMHSCNHLFYSNPIYSEGMRTSNPFQISPKSFSPVAEENLTRHPHCQVTNRSDPYYHSTSTARTKLSNPPPPPSYPAPSLPREYTSHSITPEQSSVLNLHTSSCVNYSNIVATHRAYKNVPPPPSYPAPTLPQEVSIYSNGSSKFTVNSSSSPSLQSGTTSSAILRYVHESLTPSNNVLLKSACKSEPWYENLLFLKYDSSSSRQKPNCGGSTSGTQVPHKNKFSNNSDSLQSTCKRKSYHCKNSEYSPALFLSRSCEVCSNDCKHGKKKSSVWSVFKKEPAVVKVERTFIKPIENPQRWQQSNSRKKPEQGCLCMKENQSGSRSVEDNEKGHQEHESKSASKQTRNPLEWFKKKSRISN